MTCGARCCGRITTTPSTAPRSTKRHCSPSTGCKRSSTRPRARWNIRSPISPPPPIPSALLRTRASRSIRLPGRSSRRFASRFQMLLNNGNGWTTRESASLIQLDRSSTNLPVGIAVLPALPGLGYRVGWLQTRVRLKKDEPLKGPGLLTARNQYLELEISPQSGNITRLAHLASTTEWVRASAPGGTVAC